MAPSCACTPAPLSGIVIGEPGALLATEMLPEALPVVVGANAAVKEALFPALIVTGMLRPLMLKPTPDALAWVIVNGAFPVFCKMTLFGELLPTPTLPNVTFAGVAEIWGCPAAVPEPLSAIASVAFEALLAIVIFPAALPALAGANCAVNVAPWPAGITSGVDRPITLKPVPVVVTPEIVTLAFPEVLSVMVCVPVLPTVTLPKTALAGLALKAELCVTPLPERMIVCGDPAALSVKEMLPVPAPVPVGINRALNDTL